MIAATGTPAVAGILRPVLLLPRGFSARLGEAEFESVLMHELAHVRRRDNLTGAAVRLAACLFWFHPLIWWLERKALRDGSGGDGRYRGGLGQVIAFRVQSDQRATCSVLCDRTRIPAQGFFGGGPGLPGQVLINGRAPANPKGEQTLHPGDLVEVMLPGGGGYGPPTERDPALRARDLQQGYVTGAGSGIAAG